MNVLIVGAQLANKGAESMLYIATDEIKKRYPEAQVYFATEAFYDEDKYQFKKLHYSERGKKIALGGVLGGVELLKSICKDAVKFIIGRREYIGHYFDVKKLMPSIDMVIDVSGFAVGVKWDKKIHIGYINNIKLAEKYNIPIYLMPQSFGPFNYSSDMESIKRKLGEALKYPKIIYAREHDGYEQLIHTYGLENVRLSADLVLQNKGIDWKNVFKTKPIVDVPTIDGNKCVGIVPNKQCFNHGDKEKNLAIYNVVIRQLIDDGFKVILFRHSKEDLEVCRMIKSQFEKVETVVLEEREFSCLEYDEYVKQFTFIIGSRFHGIVHAYRNHVPCIALGWAVKYEELAECVGQGEYSFDITSLQCDVEKILSALKKMEEQHKQEQEIIAEKLKDIQKNNCFNCISA